MRCDLRFRAELRELICQCTRLDPCKRPLTSRLDTASSSSASVSSFLFLFDAAAAAAVAVAATSDALDSLALGCPYAYPTPAHFVPLEVCLPAHPLRT